MIFPSPCSAVQQVDSFALHFLSTRSQEILLEAKDSNCLVLAADQELRVYSLKGVLLASFKDHALPVTSVCAVGCTLTWSRVSNCISYMHTCTVTWIDLSTSLLLQDSFRVVTASRDLSLRVLTWRNDSEGGLTLESRYHLLGGSHTMSRSFGLFVSFPFCISGSFHVVQSPRSCHLFFSGFTHVACDYSSLVASAEGKDGKDVLKAYSFTS